MNRLNAKLKRILTVILPLVPFVLGYIGYKIGGKEQSDALYGSLLLYKGYYLNNATNIWLEFARWLAMIVTLSIIVRCSKTVWNNIVWQIDCFFDDSVAVYSNDKIRFGKETHEFYPNHVIEKAKSHIILKDSDAESFKFYAENKDLLKNKKVYIGLREIDLGLVAENPRVNYFDINGSISRILWRRIALWRKAQKEITISIYGDGDLAEMILTNALLHNLYLLDQKITYNVIGMNPFVLKHPEFKTMNSDVINHFTDKFEGIEAIRNSDYVIVADELPVGKLQTIVANCGKAKEIYYYSRHEGDFADCVYLSKLEPFGRDKEIYTDENIRQEALLRKAKELNRVYAEKYNGESDWNKLSGFLKWSNISSADFMHVLKEIMSKGAALEDLSIEKTNEYSELEHIRWCRFHFINYWNYGIPENGKNKDNEKRIHKCLCQYSELSEEDKQKDRDLVERIHEQIVNNNTER